jgi:hypothetical protein
MSGGGLTWTQWDAISGTGIKAALWYALALSPFSDAVTANLASSVAASIIVSAYYNVRVADTTGTASIAANGVRTHGTSATSSPSVSDTASYSNCLGVGVCASDTVLSASAGSGMTLNAQDAAATTARCVQSRQNAVAPYNTSETFQWSYSASVNSAMVAVWIAGTDICLSLATGSASKTAGTTMVANNALAMTGSTQIVLFAMDDDGASPGAVSCADSASPSNTFSLDADKSSGGTGTGSRVVIFSAHDVNGNFVTTVTHPSVTARAILSIFALNLDKKNCNDANNKATGTGTTPSAGSISTLLPNELLVCAIGAEGPGTDSFSAGSGWTKIVRTGTTGGSGATNQSLCAEFRVTTAPGTYTGNATITSADWAAAVVGYKGLNAFPYSHGLSHRRRRMRI